jgi:tetratricopeptide (TPR) repeat protein
LVGFAAVEEGRFAAAPEPLEESLRMFRDLGDDRNQAIATDNLAWAYDELGQSQRARKLREENLRRAEALGNDRLRFFTLSSVANDLKLEGRLADALELFQESVRAGRTLDDPVHTTYALTDIAQVLATAKAGEPAAVLLAWAKRTLEELGIDPASHLEKQWIETQAMLEEQLNEETLVRSSDQAER